DRAYHADRGHWGYAGSESDHPQEGEEQNATEPQDQGPGGTGKQGAGDRENDAAAHGQGQHGYGLMGGSSGHTSKRRSATNPPPGGKIERDETLQHPRCVMNLLRKHFARYTPEVVSQICGCKREEMI